MKIQVSSPFLAVILLLKASDCYQIADRNTGLNPNQLILLPTCTPQPPDIFRIFQSFRKQGTDIQRIIEAASRLNTSSDSTSKCTICSALFDVIKSQVDACASLKFLTEMVTAFCHSIKLSPSPAICSKIGAQFLPLIYAVIQSNSDFDAQSACALLLQGDSACGSPVNRKSYNLALNIPPPPLKPRSASTTAPSSGGNIKIIHLTDFHLDLSYNPNSTVASGGIIGCRSKSAERISSAAAQAGPCGQYGCDSSLSTVCSAFAHAAHAHCSANATLLLFLTGDYYNFELDEQSRSSIEEHVDALMQKCVFKYFAKGRCNARIYPVIGNHDSYPAFSFPSRCFNVTGVGDSSSSAVWSSEHLNPNQPWYCNGFVYNSIARNFKGHLSTGALKSLQHLGYYFEDFSASLRIVVLNTNLPYKYNFYLTQNFKDVEQLQWFVEVLADAEARGMGVYILLHVPPGVDMWYPWCHKFAEVLGRFRSTIRGVFGGHEHRNDLRLLNGTTVYLASSVTTFGGEIAAEGASAAGGVNPCYSVYEVDDGATWKIADKTDYCYDVGECRKTGDGFRNWKKLCSLKEVLGGVPDLEFETVEAAVKGLRRDKNKFDKFYRCYSTNSPVQSCDGCAPKLLRTILNPCPRSS